MKGAILGVLLAAAAAAQPGPADLIVAMEDAVARLDYGTAEDRAREALARFDALSPDQLVTVHSTLGILLHAQDEPVEARRHFEAALSIDPSLRLDPVLVSPKTVEFFDGVRSTMPAPGSVAPSNAAALRYVLVEDRRTGAAFRSLVLPGWGQFYKGDDVKGWAFALTAGAVVAGVTAASLQYDAADDRYREFRGTQEEIRELYDEANRWYLIRGGLVRGAAVVWGAAMLDALLTGGPEPVSRLSVEPAEAGVGLSLRARF